MNASHPVTTPDLAKPPGRPGTPYLAKSMEVASDCDSSLVLVDAVMAFRSRPQLIIGGDPDRIWWWEGGRGSGFLPGRYPFTPSLSIRRHASNGAILWVAFCKTALLVKMYRDLCTYGNIFYFCSLPGMIQHDKYMPVIYNYGHLTVCYKKL